MRKVKTDNSDLIEYVNTVKELKNHIPIEEYRNEYRKLRSDEMAIACFFLASKPIRFPPDPPLLIYLLIKKHNRQ